MTEQNQQRDVKNENGDHPEFDYSKPIEKALALNASFGGNEKLFLAQLKTFEEVHLNECLVLICNGVELGEADKISSGCSKLKGQSTGIGAGRVHFACTLMEKAQ